MKKCGEFESSAAVCRFCYGPVLGRKSAVWYVGGLGMWCSGGVWCVGGGVVWCSGGMWCVGGGVGVVWCTGGGVGVLLWRRVVCRWCGRCGVVAPCGVSVVG